MTETQAAHLSVYEIMQLPIENIILLLIAAQMYTNAHTPAFKMIASAAVNKAME